ncbi:MAG: T6SS phospholipase effector Tle1-like catalytic domain-containing protein [Nitrospiraceae bacterium]
MGKNIIICSDGTGNTFDSRITNVTHLIECLTLDNHKQQVAVYDQGVGTSAHRCGRVYVYKEGLNDTEALRILPPPIESRFRPKAWLDCGRGLLFGYGLKENVREMYRELSNLYGGPDDRVFLFGFSRGAFTVRALAGLLYRCRLPPPESTDFDRRFTQAWELYESVREDETATIPFREKQRSCRIHFLGIWDTVKSYGGLNPVILPHLRHNPIVRHVRHALALHEHRAWFQPTTWGLLDIDKKGAMTRLKKEDLPLYEQQDIDEVWFMGCHSDIGGGKEEEVTARIALRWMLGEAVNVERGLRLNDKGKALLKNGDPPGPAKIHDLWNFGWWAVEQVPRKEIDNSGTYPVKKWVRGSNGTREPERLLRRSNGTVFLHETVDGMSSIPGKIVHRHTKSAPGGA